MPIDFDAPDYHADGSLRPSHYTFDGSEASGWEVQRDHRPILHLGRGYRALPVSHCGVCSTDLARRHLPFPLPQVIGHEVVCRDSDDRAVVVGINASHAARALPEPERCAQCRTGLSHHCPDRLVLGIHDLPGGFGPWVLAPTAAVLRVPPSIDPRTAALVEPFAAALHAARAVRLRDGERVAIIGPGRLGTLLIAALAADRAAGGPAVEIVAVGRRPDLLARARTLGADTTYAVDAVESADRLVEVAIDTTGSTAGLSLALCLATREVHVKSTTGQPTLGLAHLTELVVDEVTLARLGPADPTGATVLSPSIPAALRRQLTGAGASVIDAAAVHTLPLGGADTVVVTSVAEIDWAIRPRPATERGVVRARGTILVADLGQPRDPLLAALLDRGLRLSTSRCGDFQAALALLADTRHGVGAALGGQLIEAVLPAERLADAFAMASRGGSKIVVTHPGGLL